MSEQYKGELQDVAPRQQEQSLDDRAIVQLASIDLVQIDAQRQKTEGNMFYLNNGDKTGYWNLQEGIDEIEKIDHYRTPWEKLKALEQVNADTAADIKVIEDRSNNALESLNRITEPTEESARMKNKAQEALRYVEKVRRDLEKVKNPLRVARKNLEKQQEKADQQDAEEARKRALERAA